MREREKNSVSSRETYSIEYSRPNENASLPACNCYCTHTHTRSVRNNVSIFTQRFPRLENNKRKKLSSIFFFLFFFCFFLEKSSLLTINFPRANVSPKLSIHEPSRHLEPSIIYDTTNREREIRCTRHGNHDFPV